MDTISHNMGTREDTIDGHENYTDDDKLVAQNKIHILKHYGDEEK